MSILRSGLPVGAYEQQACLTGKLPVHARSSRSVAGSVIRHTFERCCHLEAVAWNHLSPESRAVDAAEEHQAAGETVVGQNGKCAGLSEGLEHEHSGQHGIAGEVSGEEGLLPGQIPTCPRALPRVYLKDLVDEQERRPVRQDVFGFEHGFRR